MTNRTFGSVDILLFSVNVKCGVFGTISPVRKYLQYIPAMVGGWNYEARLPDVCYLSGLDIYAITLDSLAIRHSFPKEI